MSRPSNTLSASGAEAHSFEQQRSILHLDLDTFFVSVERRMDSRLEDRPILIGGTGQGGGQLINWAFTNLTHIQLQFGAA